MEQNRPDRRLPTALALMVAALLPHLPTLGSAFLADTHGLVLQVWDEVMLDPLAFFTKNLGGGFRPLTGLSFFATAWLAEGYEPAHRAIQFALHAATTLVVWRVAASLGSGRRGAVVAALLFAWSPCIAMAVPWIAARPDVTAGLSAGLVYLALRANLEGPSPRRLALLYGASLLLAMSKEVGMLVPVLVVAAGRGRPRYLPLLLITAGLVLIRIYFHSLYGSEIQREYSPFTLFREPERLLGIAAGGGQFAFALLSCTFGPHQLHGSGWEGVAAVAGYVLAVAVAAATWRRAGLALAFALTLMVPNVPFLARSMGGFRMYSIAVFAMPLLLLAVRRWRWTAKWLPWVLLATSLVGTGIHTATWLRASDTFRDTLDRLEPERRRIEDEWRRTGKPIGVEVLGLPEFVGRIPVFPEAYALLTLQSPYFTYYRSTDPGDPAWRQRKEIGWYAGTAPEAIKAWFRSQGYPVVTIDLRQ